VTGRNAAVGIGDLEMTPFVSSRFRLDGGSMFGVVPRPLWERKTPPDERNRIALTLNSLLVRSGDRTLLVEAGMGSKFTDRGTDIYALEQVDAASGLERLGVRPEEIDAVVLTHLHLDHAGGCTRLDERGDPVPVFPNAEVFVQSAEWEEAVSPHPVEKGSYLSEDFVPLERAGLLRLVEGAAEIAPGVSVERAPGHTGGHQVVRFVSGDGQALYPGDLLPTTAHLRLSWLMGWDMEPAELYDVKARMLEDAAARGTVIFFTHDPGHFCARIAPGREGEYEIIEGTALQVEG